MKMILVVGALTLAVAIPRVAAADQPVSVAVAKKLATERYNRGVALYRTATQKNDPALFEEALLEFRQAFSIYPDDKVLWNLAASELETHRYVEAIRDFRTYDEHQKVLENPQHPKHALLRSYLETAQRATGHVEISAPPGARLLLDGKDIGVSPLTAPVDVTPGKHSVEAVSGGQSKGRREIDIAAGSALTIRFEPEAPAVSASEPIGPALVHSTPHRDVVKNQPEERSFWSPRKTLVLGVGGGTSLALLATGIAFTLTANSEATRASDLASQIPNRTCSVVTPTCSDRIDALESERSKRDIATGFFVGTGVAVAATVALLVFLPETKRPAATVVPLVSPSVGGVLFTTSF